MPALASVSMRYPAPLAPKRLSMTTMPGTNHCQVDPAPTEGMTASSGPKSTRKTRGSAIWKTSPSGFRSPGRISRTKTIPVWLTRFTVSVLLSVRRGWWGRTWSGDLTPPARRRPAADGR